MPRLAPTAFTSLLTLVLAASAAHSGLAQLPGVPVRSWQDRASDGGSVRIFFRNEATTTQTVSMITLERCVNTREPCGDYPVHLVIEPGQTVMGMRVQRYTTNRPFSFSSAYRVDVDSTNPRPMVKGQAPPRMLTADQVHEIEVEEFVPAVKAMTGVGTCGTMQRGILTSGEQALSMFFSPSKRSKAERAVSVIFNADGLAISYNDQRGDFFTKDPSKPDEPPAHPRTIIALNLAAHTGMLRNDGGGLPETFYRVSGPDLVTAKSLGNPAEVISRIWKECRQQ